MQLRFAQARDGEMISAVINAAFRKAESYLIDRVGGGVLRVFERQGRKYRPLPEPYFFEDIGLGVRLWEGTYEGIERTSDFSPSSLAIRRRVSDRS